jgi:hypothetical protein
MAGIHTAIGGERVYERCEGLHSRLRVWIEPRCKCIKCAGWQWQRTGMTQPDRAALPWSAATRWLLSVGGMAQETIAASTPVDVSDALANQRRAACPMVRPPV